MASLDIMSLFEFDIAAFGEGKEVEMSKKNQKSDEELAKFSVDESLGDLARTSFLLKKGQSMQRVSVLSTLFSLFEPKDAEASMGRLLPVIESVLTDDSSTAEECTAASGALLQLVQRYAVRTTGVAGIAWDTVNGLLDDESRQDVLQDLTSAAVALTADNALPRSTIVDSVIPCALKLGAVSETATRRAACCSLLGAVCDAHVLDPDEVERAFMKQAMGLCQDTESVVRKTMAEVLCSIASSVPQAALMDSLLEELQELLRDEERSVRCRAVDCTISMFHTLPPGVFREVVLPELQAMMVKTMEEAPTEASARRASGAGAGDDAGVASSSGSSTSAGFGGLNLGAIAMPAIMGARDAHGDASPVTHALASLTGPLLVAMVAGGDLDPSKESDVRPVLEFVAYASEHPSASIRMQCARNLPALARALDPDGFRRHVQPLIQRFLDDTEQDVRQALAGVMHGVAREVGAQKALRTLKDPLIYLLADRNDDVSGAVVDTMYDWMPAFACDDLVERHTAFGSLLSAVFSSTAAQPNSTNWRRHIRLLGALRHLPTLYPNQASIEHALEMTRDIVEQGAAPARAAAVHTLVFFLRYAPKAVTRAAIGEYIETDIRRGAAWWRRALFSEVVGGAVWIFSRAFIKAHLLESLTEGVEDPVPNVRAKCLQALPLLRLWLVFPKDAEAISKITNAAKVCDDDPKPQVAMEAAVAMAELSRLEAEFCDGKSDIDRVLRDAMARANRYKGSSVDAWCCTSAFLRCPYLPPDTTRSDAERDVTRSRRRSGAGGGKDADDGDSGGKDASREGDAEDAFLPVDAARRFRLCGAPSAEEEKTRAAAEVALESQAAEEEEEDSRRVMEERRAEARSRAEREKKEASATARARNWDAKRIRHGGSAGMPPRPGGVSGRDGAAGSGRGSGAGAGASSGVRGTLERASRATGTRARVGAGAGSGTGTGSGAARRGSGGTGTGTGSRVRAGTSARTASSTSAAASVAATLGSKVGGTRRTSGGTGTGAGRSTGAGRYSRRSTGT